MEFLGLGPDSDDDHENELDFYQQLQQAQLDVDIQRRRPLEPRRQAQPPPVRRHPSVEPRLNAPNAERARREGLRPRYIPRPPDDINFMPLGAGNPAAPAASNANDFIPRFAHYYSANLDPRRNFDPYLPPYVVPPVEDRMADRELSDEVAARGGIQHPEAAIEGMLARLSERVRCVIARNVEARAMNDPIPDRLRENYEGYQQRHYDALRREREEFARQMRIHQDALNEARNEARRLGENMRGALGMPPLAPGEGAPVRPGHDQPVVQDEARRIIDMIAEGEASLLHNAPHPMWPAMADLPGRVEAQHGRDVLWDARPPAADGDDNNEDSMRRSEEARQFLQKPGLPRIPEPTEVRDARLGFGVMGGIGGIPQPRYGVNWPRHTIVQPGMREGDLGDMDDDDVFMVNALVPALPQARRAPEPRFIPGGGQQRARSHRDVEARLITPPRPAPGAQRQSPLNPEAIPSQFGGVAALFQRMSEQLNEADRGEMPSSPPGWFVRSALHNA